MYHNVIINPQVRFQYDDVSFLIRNSKQQRDVL